eukprot:7933662-Pyramimonas_sp.AAC.1
MKVRPLPSSAAAPVAWPRSPSARASAAAPVAGASPVPMGSSSSALHSADANSARMASTLRCRAPRAASMDPASAP